MTERRFRKEKRSRWEEAVAKEIKEENIPEMKKDLKVRIESMHQVPSRRDENKRL